MQLRAHRLSHPRADSPLPLLALALLLSFLAATPLAAGTVYVPVLPKAGTDGSTVETEVWLSTHVTSEREATVRLVPADSDGTKAPVFATYDVPGKRTFLLTSLARQTQPHLFHVTSDDGMAVQARLLATEAGGGQSFAEVPVVSSANQVPADATVQIVGLERDPTVGHVTDFGVINLGQEATECTVAFFRADGTEIQSKATIALKPVSLRYYHDALDILGETRIWAVRFAVTCDQPFFPFAVFAAKNGHTFFLTPSSGRVLPSEPPPPPPGPNSVVFERTGLIHHATRSNPKGIVDIPVPSPLNLRRLIIDMDFTPGPWNTERSPNNHGIIWLHRGKFRSNTISNFNAFGPTKFSVKFNQNVDLPAGQVTSSEGGLHLTQGKTYHLRYIYDAEKQSIDAIVSADGVALKQLHATGTARGRVLTIPGSGLVAEFGHYFGQHGPEVASPGWKYSNLRVEMVKY